jgi:predicted phage tail component-like protein
VINGGFTLDDVTAKELGIVMIGTSRRPILPPTVDRTIAIPGRNGAWDFGADVGPRQINLDCALIEQNAVALQLAVEKLAAILVDGYGKPRTMRLVFDLRPDRYYMVRYSGSLDIDRIIGLGRFTLPFIAFDPYPRSITGTDGVIMDSYIILNSYIRLNDAWKFAITGPQTVEVNNWGTLASEPEIVITGSFTALSITANGKTFGYSSAISGQTLVIDCERMTVKLNGANALAGMTGDFPALMPGINEISINGTGLNCTVSFNFHPKYV